VLSDAQWQDDPMLVEMVCRTIAPQRGVTAKPEEVLITLGSQHALHLVSQALVRAGVRVAMEDPGYVDARNIFLLSGGDVIPVPVDDSGIVVDPRVSRADMVYVTPSHQYPTNATMSFSRRKRILAAAREHDLLVIEDDYDQEFRYRGTPTVALKALDADSRVIYVSSFSKGLAPGLRLGFIIADPALIAELRLRARYSVRHPPGQLQRALAQFIATGQYGRHLRRVKKHYKRKWEACTAAIERHFDWCSQRFPPGGMSVWVQGPAKLDAQVLAEHAEREGVLIEPGTVCFLRRPRPANYFKLGFAAIPLEAIEPGIARLAPIVRRLSG
jgi:GntR family transcriptional regulator/MocR family aminotransferase